MIIVNQVLVRYLIIWLLIKYVWPISHDFIPQKKSLIDFFNNDSSQFFLSRKSLWFNFLIYFHFGYLFNHKNSYNTYTYVKFLLQRQTVKDHFSLFSIYFAHNLFFVQAESFYWKIANVNNFFVSCTWQYTKNTNINIMKIRYMNQKLTFHTNLIYYLPH